MAAMIHKSIYFFPFKLSIQASSGNISEVLWLEHSNSTVIIQVMDLRTREVRQSICKDI
jgi:hypothetical protein